MLIGLIYHNGALRLWYNIPPNDTKNTTIIRYPAGFVNRRPRPGGGGGVPGQVQAGTRRLQPVSTPVYFWREHTWPPLGSMIRMSDRDRPQGFAPSRNPMAVTT